METLTSNENEHSVRLTQIKDGYFEDSFWNQILHSQQNSSPKYNVYEFMKLTNERWEVGMTMGRDGPGISIPRPILHPHGAGCEGAG